MRRRQFTSHFKMLFRSRFRIIFTFFKLTNGDPLMKFALFFQPVLLEQVPRA